MKDLKILKRVPLKDIDYKQEFFNSLRRDYGITDFNDWFLKKAKKGMEAYVKYNEEGKIQAFLMLQTKDIPEEDIFPLQQPMKRIKISTLKIADSGKSQRLSEAMMNIIFSAMDFEHVEEAYVTLFKEKQDVLYHVLTTWGFIETGLKKEEIVMTKSKDKLFKDVKKDYRWYFDDSKKDYYLNSDIYFMALEEEYHDKLFPESKLYGVSNKAQNFDISSISITKTYISNVKYSILPKPGDFLLEYRMSNLAPKQFKSVVTGIGIITEVIDCRDSSFEEWKRELKNTSVFGTEEEFNFQFFDKKRKIIIRFLHIFSFGERKNINYAELCNKHIWDNNKYQPAYPIRNKIGALKMIAEKWGEH